MRGVGSSNLPVPTILLIGALNDQVEELSVSEPEFTAPVARFKSTVSAAGLFLRHFGTKYREYALCASLKILVTVRTRLGVIGRFRPDRAVSSLLFGVLGLLVCFRKIVHLSGPSNTVMGSNANRTATNLPARPQ